MEQDNLDEIQQEIPTDIRGRICCIYTLCIVFCVGILVILKLTIEEDV
jgi:hypothetical protein